MEFKMIKTKKFFFTAVLTTVAATSHAQTFCVFDPSGTSGDSFSMMKDYALSAKQWGAELTLKAYTDEELVAKDFKSGKCDAVAITGLRAHPFNNFVASIDSVGAVVNKSQTKTIISLMANPKLASAMVVNDVEVAGVLTLGAGYLIMNDRNIKTIQQLVGKRLAIFDYDKAGQAVVDKIGAIPVPVTFATVGPMFIGGKLDVIYLPALAFKPLDIAKGLGTKGGILRFPVVAVTYDILIHTDKFSEGYGQKSRSWFAGNLNRQIANSEKSEKGIDSRYWIELPSGTAQGYLQLLREARITLAKEGVYDKKMLGILKKIRCRQDPTNAECSKNDE